MVMLGVFGHACQALHTFLAACCAVMIPCHFGIPRFAQGLEPDGDFWQYVWTSEYMTSVGRGSGVVVQVAADEDATI